MDARHRAVVALAALMAASSPAWADSSNRDAGWEYGLDLVYLDSANLSFKGGSTLDVGDDVGATFTFGYRMNPHLEVNFALDYQSANYNATIQSADTPPALSVDVKGDYEAFTPRVNVNYNFLDGAITPYVTGGIGWSFIDTNIPNGRVEVGCWWDPWYGQVCVPVQDTRSTDAFTYQLGAGVRWDASDNWSMRFAYEKHWYDFDNASGSADFDELKLGVVYRY